MSTRSLNIIKENGKVLVFWMHWDGGTAADIILGWDDDTRHAVLKRIEKSNAVVSNISDYKCIARRLKDYTERFLKAIKELDEIGIDYWRTYLGQLDYVHLDKLEPDEDDIGVFSCQSSKIGKITSVNQVLKFIAKHARHHMINDIQIGNYIDFDNKVCAFEGSVSVWNKKTGEYDYKETTFEKEIPFSTVIKKGQMTAMGNRYRPEPKCK